MSIYAALKRYLPELVVRRLALTAILMGTSTVSMASAPPNITDAEMAMIPSYCPYTLHWGRGGVRDHPTPAGKYWVSVMGNTFWAMHHYCFAEIYMLRAMKHTAEYRNSLLNSARENYIYIRRNALKNAPPTFVLLPEVHTRIGVTELRMSLPRDAEKSFAQARAIKPDYWPAYSHWVEFLIDSGEMAEAKRLVETGLKYSPNSKVLREQQRLLGEKASNSARQHDGPESSDTDKEATTPPASK